MSIVPSAWFYGISAALVCVGLALRLHHLGVRQLWLDEAFSYYIATLPSWISSLLIDNNPPLYYVLLRAWVRIAGTSEFALRLVSALSGTMFVALAIWAATEIFHRAVGLWSGLVAALSPIQIYYAQEARVYSLLDSVLMVGLVLLWRATETNRWRDWAFYGAAVLVALYSHYLALLALFPAALLPLKAPDRGLRLRYMAVVCAGVLLFVPWLAASFVFVNHPPVGTSWIEDVWNETPKLLAIPLSLEIFGFGSHAGHVPLWMRQFADIDFSETLRAIGVIALLVLGTIVAVPRGEARLDLPNTGPRRVWLATLLLGPLVLLWLISWVKPMYAVGRYDFLAYPAFPLLAGFGFWKIHRSIGPVAAALIATALVIPGAVKLSQYYQIEDGAKPKATAQYLAAEAHDGDVVVFTGLRGLTSLYYMNQLGYVWENGYCIKAPGGPRFYCRMYPRSTELTPAASDPTGSDGSPEIARTELADYLEKYDPVRGTFWVVLASASPISSSDHHLLDELLARGFVQVRDQSSNDLLIAKLRKPSQ